MLQVVCFVFKVGKPRCDIHSPLGHSLPLWCFEQVVAKKVGQVQIQLLTRLLDLLHVEGHSLTKDFGECLDSLQHILNMTLPHGGLITLSVRRLVLLGPRLLNTCLGTLEGDACQGQEGGDVRREAQHHAGHQQHESSHMQEKRSKGDELKQTSKQAGNPQASEHKTKSGKD